MFLIIHEHNIVIFINIIIDPVMQLRNQSISIHNFLINDLYKINLIWSEFNKSLTLNDLLFKHNYNL